MLPESIWEELNMPRVALTRWQRIAAWWRSLRVF